MKRIRTVTRLASMLVLAGSVAHRWPSIAHAEAPVAPRLNQIAFGGLLVDLSSDKAKSLVAGNDARAWASDEKHAYVLGRDERTISAFSLTSAAPAWKTTSEGRCFGLATSSSHLLCFGNSAVTAFDPATGQKAFDVRTDHVRVLGLGRGFVTVARDRKILLYDASGKAKRVGEFKAPRGIARSVREENVSLVARPKNTGFCALLDEYGTYDVQCYSADGKVAANPKFVNTDPAIHRDPNAPKLKLATVGSEHIVFSTQAYSSAAYSVIVPLARSKKPRSAHLRVVSPIESESESAAGFLAFDATGKSLCVFDETLSKARFCRPSNAFGVQAEAYLAHNLIVVATYPPNAVGAALFALDAKTGASVWQADVEFFKNVAHSIYLNAVTLELRGDRAILCGAEGAGRYVQVFDVATGKRRLSAMLPRD